MPEAIQEAMQEAGKGFRRRKAYPQLPLRTRRSQGNCRFSERPS